MSLEDTEKGISIQREGDELTRYYTATDIAKPHLGHFKDAFGTEITRIDNQTREHPHHRALWISHGDVNGVDTWNELPEHGYIRVQEICDRFESDVWTGFTAKNLWTDHYGKPLCTETTSFKFYNMPSGVTLIDLDITLTAEFGPVTLGPTKEAGPLAIRMADDLRVTVTGTMEAAQGAINEKEIWMKRAAGCSGWNPAAPICTTCVCPAYLSPGGSGPPAPLYTGERHENKNNFRCAQSSSSPAASTPAHRTV